MPSGSHSGGGGSHFGGGGSSFSSGGSHFGSSRSHYGGPRGPRGPVFIHFGRRYYTISYGKNSLVVFLLFISIFVGIVGIGFVASTNKDKLDVIREDYEYYYQMVELAEQNSSYQTTATITGVYKKYGKYYYTYRFRMRPSSTSPFTIDGYTYCLYDEEDLSGIQVGDTVTIAISDNVNNISFSCDSVPMDIVDFRPKDDGEYQMYERSAKTNKKVGITALIIAGALLATSITVYIVFLKKTDQSEYEKSKGLSVSALQTEEEPIVNYCTYCGSIIKPNDTACSACGAKVTKDKDKKQS